MSARRPRTPQEEVMLYKRQRNEGREDAQWAMRGLWRANHALVLELLRHRLLRIEDFELHIGLPNVLAPDGTVDVAKVNLLVADLLRRRPELAPIGPEV